MRTLRLLALAALALLSVFATSAANAHTALIGSEPADRAVLQKAPARLVLRFSEPVSPFVVRLVSPDGRTTSLLDPGAATGDVLDLPVPPGLVEGTHALSWRVVSADGHPVGGTVLFSIGAPSEAYGGGERIDWPVVALVWTTKLLLYLALFVGIGGVAYGLLIHPPEPAARSTLRVFLAIGLVSVPLALAAQGLDALGAPLGDILRPSVWLAGGETAFGRTLAIAGAAFVLGVLAVGQRRPAAASILGWLSVLGVGAALAASGHASSAPPRWATRPAVFIHGIAVAFWIGALLPLGIALQTGGASSRTALLRFSRIIPFAIVPLVLSGLVLAVVQLETPRALWTTTYGVVLIVKLVFLALLFLLAALNRWRLAAPAMQGGEEAEDRLVASIALECAVALLILAVVATWRFTPPPRSLAETAERAAVVRLSADDLAAEIAIAPGRAGDVEASSRLSSGDGKPFEAKEATFVFANPSAGIEPFTRPAARQPDGSWQAEALLPVAGRWTVRMDILIDDFTIRHLEGEVELGPRQGVGR